ncbi:MAG: phosphoglycerate kinase [Candidatus Pacebacteria bacterium]|nr:phosphoglycerate kinase [Candidatus Paceibacterota bacterium]
MINCPKIKDIKNKQVLVRVDFNVPLKLVAGKAGNKNAVWRVADSDRISSALETINFLLDNQAKVVLISHLGRADGKKNHDLSLLPVAKFLKNNLDLPVEFVNDCVGADVAEKARNLRSGQALLLENLRFYPGEEKNDPHFTKQLLKDSAAEIYINEAFSASHRAHASTVGLAKRLPSFAGFNLQREVELFSKALNDIKRPLVVVMGGAKISDKVATMQNLARLADVVLVGGGIANAMLRAGGIETHRSFIGADEEKEQEEIGKILQTAKDILGEHALERVLFENVGKDRKNLPLPKIVLPIDVLAGKDSEAKESEQVALLSDVLDTDNDRDIKYLDIGPETIRLYRYILQGAKTIVWNGPMGVFENPVFARGSREVARAIARASQDGAISLVGGGESNSVINRAGLYNQFTHVSSAGGAALEFLSGEKLPGIEVLEK